MPLLLQSRQRALCGKAIPGLFWAVTGAEGATGASVQQPTFFS